MKLKYEEALKYISDKRKFGEKHGLEGITRLCEKLGNPQKGMKFVHVAGTNGKGSTCTYISNVLIASGYKTGLYTSPFIYEFNERMRINGESISDDKLTLLMTEVKKVVDEVISEGFPEPTEFEIITAVCFLYFKRENCDIVVLEVGLGGRFDSTNIIENPECVAICSISFDHMQYLGNTISEIAFEKCGIIKEGSSVVSYPLQNSDALAVIKKTVKERNACLLSCNKEDIVVKEMSLEGNVFDFGEIKDIKTSLCGEHQIYNGALALSVIAELKNKGYNIEEEHIKKGFKEAKWPARMEKLSENPLLIFDGAHNIDGVESFVNNVKKLAGDKRVIIILGMVKDKEYDKCIGMLDGVVDVLITTTIENPRRQTAEKLMEKAEKITCKKIITENVSEALEKAFLMSNDNTVVFAVGSLYMAGEIKNEIRVKLRTS